MINHSTNNDTSKNNTFVKTLVMFKFLIIAGGLFYLFRLIMKPSPELDSKDLNEEIKNSNNSRDQNEDDDLEYTDYEEIE